MKDEKIRVTLEDLQENHRNFGRILGVEKLLALSREYGGSSIYIPKPEELMKSGKYRAILEEQSGKSVKALAKKYHVSESTVYRLMRGEIAAVSGKQKPPKEEQEKEREEPERIRQEKELRERLKEEAKQRQRIRQGRQKQERQETFHPNQQKQQKKSRDPEELPGQYHLSDYL